MSHGRRAAPAGRHHKAARRGPEPSSLAPEFTTLPRLLVLHRPLAEVRFRIATTDEWFPCHDNRTVEVSLHRDPPRAQCGQGWDSLPRQPGSVWRLAIWGADDDGRERVFETEEEMRQMAARLSVPVTKAWLERNGFVQA